MNFARSLLTALVLASALLAAAACGEPSKGDILKKAEGVSEKARLEERLGRPDDISKLGPIEQWTYKASDGTAVFIITGDQVAMQATGGPMKK